MKNNQISIDDYSFKYNSKGVLSIRYKGKLVQKTTVFEEYELSYDASFWRVTGYPIMNPGRLELLVIFLRNAVDEYEFLGKFE